MPGLPVSTRPTTGLPWIDGFDVFCGAAADAVVAVTAAATASAAGSSLRACLIVSLLRKSQGSRPELWAGANDAKRGRATTERRLYAPVLTTPPLESTTPFSHRASTIP